MFSSLPEFAQDITDWPWSKIDPFYQQLSELHLNESNLNEWLADWTRLSQLLYETHERLFVATTVDTTDKQAERRHDTFLDEIYPNFEAAEQKLKEKLLASGLEPDGFQIPLRNMRTQAALFREDNLPLLSEEFKFETKYDQIIGAQTVEWEGEELTIEQLNPIYQDPDRSVRERAWRLGAKRQLADRQAINDLWVRFMGVRAKLASNAGFSDYRAFRWQQLLRFDYSPQDCYRFQQAIEEVVVPAALRIYEKRRQRLNVAALRPWDLKVDPLGQSPLRPFKTVDRLESRVSAIFHRVDPKLGEYFEVMRKENLLDLDNRKGKAPGGYCAEFPAAKRPFIFMNAVGVHEDVQTLLHEGGHAFHVFETNRLPYQQQRQIPMEFAEVASMSMELLTAPYLASVEGGFYNPEEAARARIEHLEEALLFWPYMAIVDAFQHWVYENHEAASDPSNCDDKWAQLWDRFRVGEDWSGLQEEKETGWHRKGHIHQSPFYYVDYGLAQLGSVQIWNNALRDQEGAVIAYRKALSLGGTVTLPELYATAGAKFAFDAGTLRQVVDLMERTVEDLEAVLN